MLSVEAASRAITERIVRLGVERIALRDARGRITAEPIVATRALPPFDNSAMDGYAARAHELPATLAVVGEVSAGRRVPVTIPAGGAVRIFTGAAIPHGLDTVVMQEDARRDGDRVTLPAAAVGDHVRRAGEDVAPGELAVAAGVQLGAGELGLLAALGVAELAVVRRPRVAVIATGDELVDVTTPLAPGQIVDSSAHMLAALIADTGATPHYLGIAPDQPAAIAALITRALDCDAVITTGGVSVGDRDHVHAALAAAGVELELWKVAMKPGKPFSYGRAGAVSVFGLPGNPVSTFTAFELFVRPALLAMQGAARTTRPRADVALDSGYAKSPGRAHYLRAHVERHGDRLVARLHAKQGSAMLSSMIGCNALIELAADAGDVAAGGVVPALLLEAV